MPITIGNGFLKSEILINPPGNTKETCCEGKIIVIDGSLTQDQLPSLIAQGIDRVVSGSALFRDDRLVE
ncbi:hypothetical protein MJN51_39880, partial [Salmonella enterica subsp. enterica serovar Kentucky]|nr:hypothetical protein [Salmonella enterica subsp. enterica serovar Kentucky]